MDISRHGAKRFRGITSILSGLRLKIGSEHKWHDNVQWESYSRHIVIKAGYIPHQDGITRHDYEIRLSLEDVAALVTILGHASSAANATQLQDLLGKNIPAIVKILACATGIAPMPILDAKNEHSLVKK